MENKLELRKYPKVELINIMNEDYASFGDMEEVAHFDDLKLTLYSSPQLKQSIKEIFNKEPQTSPIIDKINKYIDNDVLIPCRYNKSLMKHLLFRTKVFFIDDLLGYTNNSNFLKRSIAGFYNPDDNKVYLLLDNSVNLFNFSYNDKIAQLTIHEFSHYLSGNATKNFFSKFENDMILFFSSFSMYYFDLNQKYNKQIIDISKRIFEYSKTNEINGFKGDFDKIVEDLINIYNEFKPYTNFQKDIFEEKLNKLKEYIYYCFINTLHVLKNMSIYIDVYKTILKAYIKGLKVPYSKIKDTFFYQEFLIPSEIVAIESIKSNVTKNIGSLM